MRKLGQSPIRLSCEIAGFVVNGLQIAMLAEAFRLVEDGICSVQNVDAAGSDGLSLRWFFMGPFETINLNAQGGVADYCAKLGPMYYDLAKEQDDPSHGVKRSSRRWKPSGVIHVRKPARRAKGLARPLSANAAVARAEQAGA